MPIRYLYRSYAQIELAGFYHDTDVCLVTPLRDGMNLVAKEFVAAQSDDSPGVLVLSRFAGAASAMKDAVIVNPYDIEGTAEANIPRAPGCRSGSGGGATAVFSPSLSGIRRRTGAIHSAPHCKASDIQRHRCRLGNIQKYRREQVVHRHIVVREQDVSLETEPVIEFVLRHQHQLRIAALLGMARKKDIRVGERLQRAPPQRR